MNERPRLDALFVYGSLLEETKRDEILDHRVEVIPARLDGYQRGRGKYFYLERADGISTRGLIMLGLGDEDWRRLDAYEELPILYTREQVEVTTADAILLCWVYLPTLNCIKL